MGLFNKLKKPDDEQKTTPQTDNRPYAPRELLVHQQHECVKVFGERYNQEALTKLPGNSALILIGDKKMKEWDSYPVTTLNGVMLGAIYADGLNKAGIKPGSKVVAEIHRPIYQMQNYVTLYIPKTNEALAAEKQREALKLWTNIDAKKWEFGDDERYDFNNVEVLTVQDGKNPKYVILGNGSKLFEVVSRMKNYPDIAERASYKPRRLIAERKESEFGIYYHVGFYY